MRGLFIALCLICGAAAQAQGSSLASPKDQGGLTTKKRTPPVVNSASPVTQAEAVEVLRKVERAIRHTLKMKTPYQELRATTPDQPVTRGFVLEQMDRLFALSQPHFKFTPRQVKFDGKVLSFPAGHPVRSTLEKMIAWGAVDRVGPLATSQKPSMTAREFGDALGFFIARMADLTHTPSTRWSPYLNGGDPDRLKPPK